MKQIDIKRLWLILKCIVVSESRQLVKKWGGIVASIFLVELFVTRVVYARIPLSHYTSRVDSMGMVGLLMLGIIALRAASDYFLNMTETCQRTQFLMIPTSGAEKFCARWLYVSVVWPLLTFTAFFAADCLRILVDAITSDRMLLSSVVALVRTLSDISWTHADGLFVLLMLSLCVLVHGFYVLGGCLFRRAQFVQTSAVGITSLMVFSKLMLVLHPFHLYTFVRLTDDGLYISPWIYVLIVSCLVGTLVLYWLSYKLFLRMQVINNKWLNV